MIFGTFDGIHAGHRNLFRQAKCHGDFLIAVVARDETVLAVKKRAPKYPECIRCAMLCGEKEIDVVVLGDLQNKYAAIEQWKPDVICLGYDQERFVEGLREHFSGEVIRLSAFEPEQYKSSKIPKEKNCLAQAKEVLRKHLLAERKKISSKKRKRDSDLMVKRLIMLPEIQKAETILLYKPMAYEVDIEKLFSKLFELGKKVLVPAFQSEDIFSLSVVTKDTKYTLGAGGFFVPSQSDSYVGEVDVCVVPCVGFDDLGNRLGRGGGWYDRFLTSHTETFSVGMAFAEQKVECVPMGKRDYTMKAFCTVEKNLPVIRRCDTLKK